MNTAHFRFDNDLQVFLKDFHHQLFIDYSFKENQSVKHLIEAMGVPHTEVGTILVNGKNVDSSYIVADKDFIDIFPMERRSFLHFPPTFVLDNHLGRLAAYLRMLGFDSLYRNDYQDDELAEISSMTERVLLTRDLRLLMRKSIRQGYWLRSKDPKIQVLEVVKCFRIADMVEPFKRCIRCNTLLIRVEKKKILSRLQPLTRKYYDDFHMCPACSQIYWQGSHHNHMKEFINQIFQNY